MGRLALAVLVPLVLLAVAEGLLRLAGAGFPTSFLIPRTVDGRAVWTENPFFTYRIFSPPLARAPAPILVDREKPKDTLRIVVLGESAAQGDPVPAFGPPRSLEYLLSARYPDRKIEVVNAAITAINSHIIREIARDLDKLDPDLVILYIGNNEVIGPYGPGTVFTRFSTSDWMVRLAGQIRRTRLAQVLGYGMAVAAEGSSRQSFGGVSMFMEHPVPADDPRLEPMYRRYRRNLEAIAGEARKVGARVLVSTVAVNRSDCPPSISTHRAGLTMEALNAWMEAFEAGVTAMKDHRWADALAGFEAAAALDDTHAELQYRLGQCLVRAGRKEEALAAFDRAMNRDAFRYRTDGRMNDLLRDFAARLDLPLVDIDRLWRDTLPLEDHELFVDHVHFTMRGTYELVRPWADVLPRMGLLPETREEVGFEALTDALMFIPVSEAAIVQRLLARYGQPPFNQQFDIQDRVDLYTQRLHDLTESIRTLDADAFDARFRERMDAHPRDPYFAVHWAQFMMSFNRYRDVETLLAADIQHRPFRRGNRSLYAQAAALLGRPVEAAETLLGWTDRHGFFACAESSHLLTAMINNGDLEPARAVARVLVGRVHRLDYAWRIQEQAMMLDELVRQSAEARQLFLAGREDEALARYERIARYRSDYPEPPYWVGVLLGRKGRADEGFPWIQRAIRQWNFARAYYHAALWRARLGEAEEAMDLLRQSARYANDDEPLVNSLAWVCAMHPMEALRDPDLALETARSGNERGGYANPILVDTLAAVEASRGRFDEAIRLAGQAEALARERGQDDLAAEIGQRLAMYRAGRPAGWGMVNAPMNVF